MSNAHVLRAFSALETLSVTVTGFVKEQADNGYPIGFVKIPDTEFHLKKAKENARACTLVSFIESELSTADIIFLLTINVCLSD